MRPIVHRDEFTESLARPIADYFTETLYGPLLSYLRENGVHPNESDQAIQHAEEKHGAVKEALLAGVIWYSSSAGVFTGKFNARISRELRQLGATYKDGVFRLADAKLPLDIKAAAVQSAAASEALHKGVTQLIDQMQANAPRAPLGIDTGPAVSKIIENLNEQFKDTVTEEDFRRAPSIPVSADAKRANDILQIQIEAPIRDFTQEQLADLRSRVQRNAIESGRADRLAKIVETRYGVAKRRAKFIGEQEASLIVSKYRQKRYTSIGLHRYKWSDSHDPRVRHDHHLLNGTVQDWAVKPVTNRKTCARNHPGEDFGCRCNAIPMTVLASRN